MKNGFIGELQSVPYSFLKDGSTLPVATPIDSTDRLIKLVPQGRPSPNSSAYWLRESEYQNLVENPGGFRERLGLPTWSHADNYDVYVTRPAGSGARVFESVIAPTRQGNYLQSGGFNQVIVPNMQLFTPPAKIGSFGGM